MRDGANLDCCLMSGEMEVELNVSGFVLLSRPWRMWDRDGLRGWWEY